jgi:hypothetical protein
MQNAHEVALAQALAVAPKKLTSMRSDLAGWCGLSIRCTLHRAANQIERFVSVELDAGCPDTVRRLLLSRRLLWLRRWSRFRFCTRLTVVLCAIIAITPASPPFSCTPATTIFFLVRWCRWGRR